MLIYYVQESVADRVVERLKRLWLFLVYAARRCPAATRPAS